MLCFQVEFSLIIQLRYDVILEIEAIVNLNLDFYVIQGFKGIVWCENVFFLFKSFILNMVLNKNF